MDYNFTDVANFNFNDVSIQFKAYRLLIGQPLEKISIYRAHPGNIYLIEEHELLSYLCECYKKCNNTTVNCFIQELIKLQELIQNFNYAKKQELINFYFRDKSFLNCYQFIVNGLQDIKCINSCSTETVNLVNCEQITPITDYNVLFFQEPPISIPTFDNKLITNIINMFNDTTLLDILLTEYIKKKYSKIDSSNIITLNNLIEWFRELDEYICSLCFTNYKRMQINI